MDDKLFQKVKKKTNVDKEQIVSLAEKLNQNGLKDEKTLREVIASLSKITGKKVDKSLEEKIIKVVKEDKVPKGVEDMF